MAQAQADGERVVRTDTFAHGQRVGFQRIKNLAPRFAAMDVRAIGEVPAVVQFHGRSDGAANFTYSRWLKKIN